MKKSRYYLFSVISGILALISLITAIIASFNLPSQVEYEVAEVYGNTLKEDFLRMLPNIMIIAVIVFIVMAIVFGVIGKIKNRKI